MRKILSYLIFDLAKCPNRKTCTFTYMRFRFLHFPRSKIVSESLFFHKVLYNYYSVRELGAFWPLFNKVKKWISHCIFKSCASTRKLIFVCQINCIYLLNSHEGPQSFNFDITYFIHNYSYPLPTNLFLLLLRANSGYLPKIYLWYEAKMRMLGHVLFHWKGCLHSFGPSIQNMP